MLDEEVEVRLYNTDFPDETCMDIVETQGTEQIKALSSTELTLFCVIASHRNPIYYALLLKLGAREVTPFSGCHPLIKIVIENVEKACSYRCQEVGLSTLFLCAQARKGEML